MGEDRTYLFSAENGEDMNRWLNRLATALQMNVAVPGPLLPSVGSPTLSHYPAVPRPLFSSSSASNRMQVSHRVPQGYDLSASSPWFANSSCSRGQRPPPLQAIPSDSVQSQSDEYKMDFDLADSDDYYRLTPNDHAYVNLPDQSSDMANAATGDGYLVAVKVPQDTEESGHLENDVPPESKAPESPECGNQSRQSVYYNVWDLDTQPSTAAQEENAAAAGAPAAAPETQLPSQPRPLSLGELRSTSETGGRAVRRSQVISEYIVLPHLPDLSSTVGQEVEGPTVAVMTTGTASQADREIEQPLDSSAPPPNVFSESTSDSESILPTRSKPATDGGSDESTYSEDEDDTEEEDQEDEQENKDSFKSPVTNSCPPSEPENMIAPSLDLNGGVDIAAVTNPIADDDTPAHDHSSAVIKEIQTNANAPPPSTSPNLNTPVLNYLDAQNLYFSKKLPQKKTPPSVPPKPVHLRKKLAEQSSVKPSMANAGDGSDPDRIEYKELDPVTTCALEYVTNLITDTSDPT
uniref:PH domain-containing protein n=1 Tax=Schistocephalus solidus TaxID=70667 RepID=A0A0X3PMZ8_SCHSO